MAKKRRTKKSGPKKRPVAIEPTVEPKEVEERLPSLGVSSRWALLVAALAVVSSVALWNMRRDTSKQVDTVTATSAGPDIFSPRSLKTVDRSELKRKIEMGLSSLAKEVRFPDDYDPSKPNMYLIGSDHVKSRLKSDKLEDAYEHQRIIVDIFHVLRENGVERQFLEGISSGVELQHDVPNSNLDEHPHGAMKGYIRSGNINRAYVAVEGVYEDDIESVGAEVPYSTYRSVKSAYSSAERRDFSRAKIDLTVRMAKWLGMDTNPKRFGGNIERLLEEVKGELDKRNISNDDLKAWQDQLFAHPSYQVWLNVAAKYEYFKIQGRDRAYAETMGRYADGKDSAMIVGSKHLGHLSSVVQGYNVVEIVPSGPIEVVDPYFASDFSVEDYKASIFAHDLYKLGIGPRPEYSVWTID